METGENVDIHLSRLAGWAMNTIGKAALVGVALAFLIGLLAAASGEPRVMYLGGIVAPLGAAIVLASASPPLPPE